MVTASIDQDLLLHILYGSPAGRRFTQDTPVLPEVWLHYARDSGKSVKGLIVPRNDHQAHHVAEELHQRIKAFRSTRKSPSAVDRPGANVADMPGLITLHCYFEEVVNVVLPLTRWWVTDGMEAMVKLPKKTIAARATDAFERLLSLETLKNSGMANGSDGKSGNLGASFDPPAQTGKTGAKQEPPARPFPDSTARLLLLLSMIHAGKTGRLKGIGKKLQFQGETREVLNISNLSDIPSEVMGKALCDILQVTFLRKRRIPHSKYFKQKLAEEDRRAKIDQISESVLEDKAISHDGRFDPRLIFTFSINREGDNAVADSVKTTKADAARRLFAVSNSDIRWAVIDSGIDSQHHAFRKYPRDHIFGPVDDWDVTETPLTRDETRVVARYDMTLISELRNRDNLFDEAARLDLAQRIRRDIDLPAEGEGALVASKAGVLKLLEKARDDLENLRPLDWDLVEQITRVRHDHTPANHHGTHVAGTLGGRWPEAQGDKTVWVEGMCPDIKLIDFNVMGGSLKATEFAVIAAMRLIRHLNERNDFMVVHGANLSLAIPHDVTNYACGRTPVCVECETLVNNGVVVVAAAGNAGYNVFKTKDRDIPLHTETSIADPGNAEAVITVGSTHRLEPHNYGVSYFSSRGPTGDGRMKPDLVAPGEKIDAPICAQQFATLEGTSMAAPHVSGAAALLMARFPELIGNAKRIKQILCDSATDLGRERAYQGCGLVDVLRALQSV